MALQANDVYRVPVSEGVIARIRVQLDWDGGTSFRAEPDKGDRDEVQRLTAHSLTLGLIFVGTLVIIGMSTIDPLFRALGAGDKTMPLIREYMSLDGTTLPPEIKVTTHGCGENFPIASTGDGQDKLENRRVELFFFDNPLQAPDRPAAILPAPPGKSSKPGSKEYPEWVLRARQTHDFFPGGDVELTSHISVVLTAGGVPVRDRPYKIYLDGGVVLEGTTGADGFLEHHDVPPGDYTLEVDGCQTTVPTLPEDTHRRLQALDDYWDDTDVSTIV